MIKIGNMSVSSLYKTCLRKIPTYLRNGIYKSCQENPFSAMPSSIVNDLVSAIIDVHGRVGFSADDLELLLISGKLQELKIHSPYLNVDEAGHLMTLVLRLLKLGCHELKVLHVEVYTIANESSELSKAIENVISNSPNLRDLVSFFPFDLKALRNCKKLRRLFLQFLPKQHWYRFLEKENDNYLPHEHLEIFSVNTESYRWKVPFDDVFIILRHCPKLISLGEIETSELLSLLHKMCIPHNELNLRRFFWTDISTDLMNQNHVNYVKDAVQYYPVIKELEWEVFSTIETVSHLRNLGNLSYLNIGINCSGNIGEVLENALQENGSRLKHLSFGQCASSSVDISIFLQYCPNLESFRIDCYDQMVFANSIVHLPRLQRLSFTCACEKDENLGNLLRQLSGCNQLTELFLSGSYCFDDEALYCFLKKNSLRNLKVALILNCSLTDKGFREFLLNAPQLEKIEIKDENLETCHMNKVANEMNHKAIINENSISEWDEYFEKTSVQNFF